MERERKRKLPARSARAEPTLKIRSSTKSPHGKQTPIPAAPPQPRVEKALPTNIVPGTPLPTLDEPQSENLPNKEYQSVSESGVLQESLLRSRQKWLSADGIFEKYWTKPVKKKGALDVPPNNPPKESMTKLGSCTITVEPHLFEATMYAIKDPTPRAEFPPVSQPPIYRHIIQHGPQNGMMPPPAPIPPPAQQKHNTPETAAHASPRNSDTVMGNTGSASTPNALGQVTGGSQNVQNGQRPGSTNTPSTTPQTSNLPSPAPSTVDKSKDPVIQMLAERASTNSDLKALMRIVANGQATPEELKKFQGHIDDLTRLQAEKARQAASLETINPHHNPPNPPPGNSIPTPPPVQSPAPAPVMAARTPTPTTPVAKPESQFQIQPQALRSKGPMPPTKPDISGVVFDFSGGSGDRFLFPKFSILEYLPQGQVVASFLIVRKGSNSESPTYDHALDYYQPITIRLYAHQGRQLDALQKVVAQPDEVRRYMDNIMDNMTRAEYVLLAMRLPKDMGQEPTETRETMENPGQTDDTVLWATTKPTTSHPVKARPAKKAVVPQDKYQSFINTISVTGQ
ncbi:hypothetical protein BJ875DRAFT_395798 [Amylocarpus encephaloides]|uniref:SWR1-complex protein 3 domain-containing protein n=1 Tax=Amylocarpus encephaloides TaxID=45428 RepID=A0A9P7YNL4_9HELO|nr:hypothetical protein BJ875DRAFT_395798 [Amylocarpus encephaloides]